LITPSNVVPRNKTQPFFRATFFGLRCLVLATLFFRFNLVAVRLTALPRTGMEDLRALPRTVDFLFRAATRFLRLAMIPAYSDQRRQDTNLLSNVRLEATWL
jgi:hypothetical protein